MPRELRDERRRRRTATAQQWARWLNEALASHKPPLLPVDLVKRSGGAFQTGHVAHWTNGDNTASAEAVLLIARIVGRDPVEALRAAGHHTLADQIVELVEEAIRGEELLERQKGTDDNRTAL